MEISTLMPYLSLSAGSMNTVLEVDIDSTNVVNPLVRCQFEPGFTIDYGIDPLYTDLTGRDTTSTLGRVTTITFSQDLIGDTTYYFSVSAESTSICERVCGIFRIGGCKNSGVQLTQ